MVVPAMCSVTRDKVTRSKVESPRMDLWLLVIACKAATSLRRAVYTL